MDEIGCVVIGAGVVGTAVARALAQAGREVLVLEAAEGIGTGTSSRNSEVIHAGIYYPRDSLMARLCVRGKRLLYDFCRSRGVAFRNCGKLIVATDAAEMAKLDGIRAAAAANGVDDLRLLTAVEARTLEPALACTAALLSPSTGIVDSHGYMLALQGEAGAAGALFAFRAPVTGGRVMPRGVELDVGGAEPMALRARLVVNAAGLSAPAVASGIVGMPRQMIPTPYYAKGNYFVLAGRNPFGRLIYPVPVPGGLGVHLTIDLAGQARFGPDVEWVPAPDYTVDPARAESFYAAIRRYWPDLADGALQPGYAGVRPKIVPPAIAKQDFVIQGPAAHGVAGLVNLFGIESPGLTAAIALAEAVCELADG
ncbi:MAG: NAD(P)/FAD-dependent oxidoreductase [Rhodospirillales bacterium]|nr:NAD(P)/FAD-dependent oxidoreductase [Rhodospirillales bacterium]